ncbi:MAG: glyoxalase [Sphingomonadaceae bacterium]|nr:glyoxalase [Sphingomonadaceae bacterium]
MIVGLDHVQLAMPGGGENEARAFYIGLLGMVEVPKPPALAARGGCWFELGPVKLHLGVEEDFRAARKAHPGLLVDDFDGLCAALRSAGHEVLDDHLLPGVRRAHVADPFGNRIELIAA